MQFSYFFLLKSFSIPFHAYNNNYFLEIRTLQKCEALRKNCQIYAKKPSEQFCPDGFHLFLPDHMDIEVVIGDLNARLVQRFLGLLQQIVLDRPEV